MSDDRPPSFDTVREVNGVRYEHVHTTFVERNDDGTVTLDEHVLVNNQYATVRVVVPDWETQP